MASFSAELHVAGYVIPLIRCTYGTHQDTDVRGRVISKVRRSLVDNEADVPEHQVLEGWAADPRKRQEAIIIFRNADTGAVWETLHLKAAYCVGYRERFVSGDMGSGSYRCFFSLSDPDGWDWYPGALPNQAAIRPAPREHGTPPAPVAALGLSDGQKPVELKAGTPAHKAVRWAEYQAANITNPKAWTQTRWERQYETNMRNAKTGLAREREYAKAMNAESKTLKTPVTYRQVDLFNAQERYCGQLKTGKMSLNKQARTADIPKDAELVKAGFEVEYILEKGGSKPFLKALDEAGATYKVGPQIP